MDKVTLREFLLYHTQCYELCVIRLNGWIIFTAWIDDEDLFEIPSKYLNYPVTNDKWGTLVTVREDGTRQYVNCHYIYI